MCLDGCDGCINLDHPDNQGFIPEIVNFLNSKYDDGDKFKPFLTRADFYALASIVAVEQGVKNANAGKPQNEWIRMPQVEFKYCRKDCSADGKTNVNRPFPHGHFDHDQVMSFFNQQFGLTKREATALMGGHTLGGANGKIGSGFKGFWKESKH